MKRVIIKYRGILPIDELERLEYQLKQDLDNNGFIVVDNTCEIIEFDDGKEESNG